MQVFDGQLLEINLLGNILGFQHQHSLDRIWLKQLELHGMSNTTDSGLVKLSFGGTRARPLEYNQRKY